MVSDPPLREADYWRVRGLAAAGDGPLWNESESAYTRDSRINACGLMTHAIAALEGHDGPARRDERARRLAARLCESPPFRPTPRGGPTRHTDPRSESQRHAPGWVTNISAPGQPAAHHRSTPRWRAPSTTRGARASSSSFRRSWSRGSWQSVRVRRQLAVLPLSQHPPQPDQLRGRAARLRGQHDRRHDAPAARLPPPAGPLPGRREARRAALAHSQPGPSYSFHRNPFQRAGNRQNIESTEYATIVLDVIYYYEQARRAGMSPLSEGQARTLRAWLQRALPAYWTHSGYLNWDTGLYLYRWHLSRYWAWSCQGLLAIASSQNFVDDDERRWAKYIFDRSLACTSASAERWDDDRREPGSSLYGDHDQVQRGPALRAGPLPGAGRRGGAARTGRQGGRGAAAAVRVRPPDRAPDDHDSHLQHGAGAGQQRRLPLRRDRPRAAVRLAPAGGLAHRRPRAGRVRAGRAGGERHDRGRLAAPAHGDAAQGPAARSC